MLDQGEHGAKLEPVGGDFMPMYRLLLVRGAFGTRNPRCYTSAALSVQLRPVMKPRSTLVKDPVRCALMSGLSRGARRWPSWVCACVSGTNLSRVLEAQRRVRYCLKLS